MKLIIHAGIHRTGTSSLQDFLASNRQALRQRGVFYPGKDKNHQHLAWGIKRGDLGAGAVRKLLEKGQGICDTLVLSAEDFCIHKDLAWLEEIAKSVPTSVHFYLRRQDHWLMSWYNQHIKWPFHKWKSRMPPSEFLDCIDEFYWIDFANLIGLWEKVLGADSVHVSVVEPGQVEDVTGDFISHIGIGAEELPNPAKRVNDSMPIHLLEVTRHLGLYEMAPAMRIKMLASIRKALPMEGSLPKTVYSPAQRHNILNRFASSNRALAASRFKRDELFLEPLPADSDPYYQFPEITRDDYLRDWIKPIVLDLLKRRTPGG